MIIRLLRLNNPKASREKEVGPWRPGHGLTDGEPEAERTTEKRNGNVECPLFFSSRRVALKRFLLHPPYDLFPHCSVTDEVPLLFFQLSNDQTLLVKLRAELSTLLR